MAFEDGLQILEEISEYWKEESKWWKELATAFEKMANTCGEIKIEAKNQLEERSKAKGGKTT